MISNPDGSITAEVEGTHDYTDPGDYAVDTTFYLNGIEIGVVDSRATVSGGNGPINDGILFATPASIAPDQLTAGTFVLVGSFTAGTQAVSADFSVTANWGNGDVDTAGFVMPTGNGGFNVYATKSTDFAGATQPIEVTVHGQNGDETTFTDNSFTLDSGSTLAVSSLPADCNVTVDGGSTLNLEASTIDLGATGRLTLADGSIINGTVIASAYNVENGLISANLSGDASLTMSGDGYVQLTGNNTYAGTTIGAMTSDTGTLAVGPNALGSGPVTFFGPGTLQARESLARPGNRDAGSRPHGHDRHQRLQRSCPRRHQRRG